MRNPVAPLAMLLFVFVTLAGGCSSEAPPPQVEQPKITIDPAELTAFAPLPDAVPAAGGAATDDLVNLGRMLYFEPRLSKSQKISCNYVPRPGEPTAWTTSRPPTATRGRRATGTRRRSSTPRPTSCSSGTDAPLTWRRRRRARC